MERVKVMRNLSRKEQVPYVDGVEFSRIDGHGNIVDIRFHGLGINQSSLNWKKLRVLSKSPIFL
jgi:hypothetical protein